MSLLKQSDFAKQLNISRQAVFEAKKRGLLDIVKEDNKIMIDLNGYNTLQYIKNNNCQRKSLQKKVLDEIKVQAKDKSPEEIATLLKESDIIRLIYEKARAEAKQEDVKKKKLENAYKRGELISRDKVYESVMYYLDRINRGMELIGNTFLSDIGDQIITAGNVTPKIRQRWINEVIRHIDNAKKQVIKYLKKIEKEQAK